MESEKITISFNADTKTALDQAAAKENVSPSEVIERLLRNFLFKRSVIPPIVLTLSALVGLGAMVYYIMHFATSRAGLAVSYWLVPVFGSIGGAVGGVLRDNNKLVLADIHAPDKIILGVVGDICIGLGGACAVLFLFGNTLRITPGDAPSNVLLISISFLAGVVGKQLIELASNQLAEQAKKAGAKAGTVAAEKVAAEKSVETEKKIEETQIAPLALRVYREIVTRMNSEGKADEALPIIEDMLKYNPRDVYLYVEKGRALKRQNKTPEALATIEHALTIEPNDHRLLYNRACYKTILNMNRAEILADLKRVFESVPQYCEAARKDADLETIRGVPEFNDLILKTLDEALRNHRQESETALLRYSKACYLSRLNREGDGVVDLLKQAFASEPKFKEWALRDKERDLAFVSGREEFKKLLE